MGRVNKVSSIDDRPWETLTFEEKNAKTMWACGEPWHEPTAEEEAVILRKFGLEPDTEE